MAELKKYPTYVTTDSDLWNSADEAYFYVVKGKAKPLTNVITPIIEKALENGMLREATEEEITEYELDLEIEKKIRERRFEAGKTYEETKEKYFEWKKSYDKQQENKIETTGFVKEVSEDDIEKTLKETKENNTISGNITTKPIDKSTTETQKAINQKPSVSTKTF